MLNTKWTDTVERYIREGRTVSGGKGDTTAQAAETSQAAFNNQLQQTFSTQLASQTKTLNYLQGKLQPMIDNPTGYSPEALAAMRTSATDTDSAAFQNAQKALQGNNAVASGDLPSGVQSQLDSALLQQEAGQKSSDQNNITLQDENLKESNYWNAINGLNGVATEANPLGYAGAATSGSGAVAGLSQANTAASGPTFGAILGGIAGGVGTAAGGYLQGKYCYVAAACFNEDFHTGVKTNIVRNYLWNVWSKNWYAPMFLKMYSRYGKWVATKPLLVSIFKPLFEAALRCAERAKG